jgi:TolB-like protein
MPFAFADCVLDPDRRELTRGTDPVATGPQVFDLLLYLVQNRERVVTRDDLLDAVWAGRIVSESTLASHINAVRKAIGDNGTEQRLIRTVARKGLRFVGEVRELEAAEAAPAAPEIPATAGALPLPDKPSIAVLPFVNLSGDPEQDYFADGVVEDITAALSRMRWLFVIARNSSFTYKGRTVDVTDVGRALGVRYILEGSIRKAANRIRITGQLIDAHTRAHLWADRFEGALDDIFELQDQLATSVVGAIAPELERAEIERAKRKPTESLDAYDYYLRGMANLNLGTRAAIDEALPLFMQAVTIDPAYASAYGMAAWCLFWRKINGWMTDRMQETAEGKRLARLAVELGRDDAVALTRGGHALGHLVGDLDGSISLLERAKLLNPNLVSAWFLGGYLRVHRGDLEDGIAHLVHAMRLSPLDPEVFRIQAGIGLAHLYAGRFGIAASWAEKAVQELPDFLFALCILAASQALAGQAEKARHAMAEIRRLDPTLRIANLQDWLPINREEHRSTFADGLRQAGLPD